MVRLLLALTLVASVLTACGDTEEKNDYVDALNAAQQRYVDAAAGFGTNPANFGEDITKLTEATDELIADVEELDPPDEVTSEHEDIVAALTEFNETVKPLTEDLKSDDPATSAEAVAAVAKAAAELGTSFDASVNAINDKLHD